MRKIILITFLYFNFSIAFGNTNNELYEKIDIFGEVLEKIKTDYVDDVNQSEVMDSSIIGFLQSLDPYSAYMSPEIFKEMQTDLVENLVD